MVRWVNNPPGLWFPNCWIYAGFVELVGSNSNKLNCFSRWPDVTLYPIILRISTHYNDDLTATSLE